MAAPELQYLQCTICLVQIKEPKILLCGHLACRQCVLWLLKTNASAQCPFCNSDVRGPNDISRSCEQVVDALPNDLLASAEVDNLNSFNPKRERVCHQHNSRTAVMLCVKCQVALCESCVEIHRQLRNTSSPHYLHTMAPDNSTAGQQTLCVNRAHGMAKFYCQTHKVLVCQLCLSTIHRSCKSVRNIKDAIEQSRELLDNNMTLLSSAKSRFSQVLNQYDELLLLSDSKVKSVLNGINMMCNRLRKIIETCEQRLRNLLQRSDDSMKAAVQDAKAILNKRSARVMSHLLILNRAQQKASGEVFIAMANTLNDRIKELDLDTAISATINSFTMPSFSIDEEALERIELEINKTAHLSPIACRIGGQVQREGQHARSHTTGQKHDLPNCPVVENTPQPYCDSSSQVSSYREASSSASSSSFSHPPLRRWGNELAKGPMEGEINASQVDHTLPKALQNSDVANHLSVDNISERSSVYVTSVDIQSMQVQAEQMHCGSISEVPNHFSIENISRQSSIYVSRSLSTRVESIRLQGNVQGMDDTYTSLTKSQVQYLQTAAMRSPSGTSTFSDNEPPLPTLVTSLAVENHVDSPSVAVENETADSQLPQTGNELQQSPVPLQTNERGESQLTMTSTELIEACSQVSEREHSHLPELKNGSAEAMTSALVDIQKAIYLKWHGSRYEMDV